MSKSALFRDQVAQEMIEQMEKGTAPWVKPWKETLIVESPFNPTTNKNYQGINSFWLSMQGYEDPRWMTYKQAKASDAQVKRGEKSTQIEYWNFYKNIDLLDDQGKPMLDEKGNSLKRRVPLERPYPVYANVFNAEQIDGLEAYKVPVLNHEEAIERIREVELLLKSTAVPIYFDQADRAFYSPRKDEIHLPPVDAFKSQYEYYATALHEMGHATGHESRLARDMQNPFGSKAYAYEELRAEMASYMATTSLGLGHYPERHANYLENWLKGAKEDKHYLFRAAKEAEEISSWLLDPEKRMELEKRAQLKREAELTDNKVPVILSEEEQEKRLQKAWAEATERQQALRPEPVTEAVIEEQKLSAVYHNSNREGLSQISNFFASTQTQDENPVYLQSRIWPTNSPKGTHDVLLTANQIQNGSLSRDKLEELPRLNVTLPEVSYDKKTGLHEVTLIAIATTQKESRFWVEKNEHTDRVELSFKSHDQKKAMQMAQTFINTTRALDVQKSKLSPKDYIWLNITMENLVQAQKAGVLFSPKEKKFYAPENMPKETYAKWLPKEQELAMKKTKSQDQATQKAGAQEQSLQGKLVDHGEAPFKHDKNNTQSYFVTLEDEKGEQTTLWGIDLPRALEESGAKAGQLIELINEGRKPVTVEQAIKDENGQVIGIETLNTHRNKWTVIAERQGKELILKETPTETKAPAPEQKAKTPAKENRVYIGASYNDRHEAKTLGAQFDKQEKLWFVRSDNTAAIARFGKAEQQEAPDPVQEFSEFLKSHGVDLKDSPRMDGSFVRVAINGDKGEKNASYKAWLDGPVPNGILHLYKGGETLKWVATGQRLSAEQQATLKAERQNKMLERQKETAAQQEKTAKAAYAIWQNTKDWANTDNAPYLQKKDAQGRLGLKVNEKGETLVPLRDAKGFLHNIQTIGEETKLFMKGGRKEGLLHGMGFGGAGGNKLDKSQVDTIVITEGVGTAATLYNATKLPTVTAFDSSNLKPVALEIQKEFPNAKLIFAADNDHHLEKKPPYKNVGLEKAREAAEAVGGMVIAPVLKVTEQEKGLTDFNDLHISRGKTKAFEEIKSLVSSAQEQLKVKTDTPGKAQEADKAPALKSKQKIRQEEQGLAL